MYINEVACWRQSLLRSSKYLPYGKGLTNPSLREDLDTFFVQLAEGSEKLIFSVPHRVTKPYIIS